MPESPTKPASRKTIPALLAAACVPVAIALGVLAGSGGGGRSTATVPAAPARPAAKEDARPPQAPLAARFFSPTSFWNAPLEDDAALDPGTQRLARDFAAEVEREKAGGTGPWIQTDEYSTGVWTAAAGARKVRVKLDTGPWGAPLQRALDEGVPIPAGARPASGTDGHMTVYQPSTDSLWEFWRAKRQADGWHASWGGAMRRVSKSPGYYTTGAWPGSQPNWGSTATSLPVVGGTIMIDELRRREIPHALALDVPDTRRGEFAWPAQRSDGTAPLSALPEGARLRIDPTLDLDTLDLTPTGRALAQAAQRYGIVVRDVTHHATAFYAEDPAPSGANPYDGADGLFGGQLPSAALEGFPWNRLQVLKMSLCRSAPCRRGDSP